ncbi:MAG: LysR family transcriptional regulator [Pseudomonadota bacterium]
MDLRHLRFFVCLAEELHFGAAARRLGTTQPAVSKALREIEAELEATLIKRTSRSAELTTAGVGFLRSAREALETIDGAVRTARADRGTGVTRLALGMMLGAEQPSTGRIIKKFMDQNPAAEVELLSVSERDVGASLSDGTIDAAIGWSGSIPNNLETYDIETVQLSFLLPNAHPLAARDPVPWADIVKCPMIIPARDREPMIFEAYRGWSERYGCEPTIALDASTSMEMFAMVAAGIGLGAAPIPEGATYPGVTIRMPNPSLDLVHSLAWSRSTPVVDALIAAIKAPV